LPRPTFISIAPRGIIAKVRVQKIPSVSRVSGNKHTAMSVWFRNRSSWSQPWNIGTSSFARGDRTQAETGKPSDCNTSAGALAIMP
jgi:hypothetical protein